MRYLIDTQIFIWWLDEDSKIKDSIRDVLANPENQIFISVISGVEISIKHKKRKLKLKTTVEKMFEISGFEVLNLNLNHVFVFDKLSPLHKDPFDRILIAQAKAEGLTLITSDKKIWKYKVPLIKA